MLGRCMAKWKCHRRRVIKALLYERLEKPWVVAVGRWMHANGLHGLRKNMGGAPISSIMVVSILADLIQ